MQGRTLQIKIVKDDTPKYAAYHQMPDRPKRPEEKPEAIASDLIQTTVGSIVVGYTICRSVNFFFKMAEHAITKQ